MLQKQPLKAETEFIRVNLRINKPNSCYLEF